MYRCPVPNCQWESSTKDHYVSHVKRMHDPIYGFRCIHNNCFRRYTSVQSLRKHIENCSEGQCSNTKVISNRIPSDVQDKLTNQEVHLNDDERSSTTEAENLDSSVLINSDPDFSEPYKDISRMKDSAIKTNMNMLLKWLSHDSMPRKLAIDINNDIKTNVIKPLIDSVDFMSDCGMMSLECKQNLQSILESFNSISEYKCIQLLKNMGIYHDPEIFNIGKQNSDGDGSISETVIINN